MQTLQVKIKNGYFDGQKVEIVRNENGTFSTKDGIPVKDTAGSLKTLMDMETLPDDNFTGLNFLLAGEVVNDFEILKS